MQALDGCPPVGPRCPVGNADETGLVPWNLKIFFAAAPFSRSRRPRVCSTWTAARVHCAGLATALLPPRQSRRRHERSSVEPFAGRTGPTPWNFSLVTRLWPRQRRRRSCRAATNRNTRISKSAKPTTLRKAMRVAAFRKKRPSDGPGPPSTRTTAAARGRRIGTRQSDGPSRRAQRRQDGRLRICGKTGGQPIGGGQKGRSHSQKKRRERRTQVSGGREPPASRRTWSAVVGYAAVNSCRPRERIGQVLPHASSKI
jgi:hypothetical protein